MHSLNRISKKIILFLILPSLVIACGGGGGSSESNSSEQKSLSTTTPFVYVERNLGEESAANLEKYRSAVLSKTSAPVYYGSPYEFNPGAKLVSRSALSVDAMNTEVLSNYFQSDSFDVKDLSVSADGKRILFAGHGPAGDPHHSTWSIYEYSFEAHSVRRIIADDAIANAGQDTSPTYTETGRIVFSTDRAAGNPNSPVPNIITPELEENCYKIEPEEKPSLLHSMTTEGGDILQLTYGSNHDINPTTLRDGRIAFVRWSRSYEQAASCGSSTYQKTDISNATHADLFKSDYPSGISAPINWSDVEACQYSRSSVAGQIVARNNYTLLRISADGSELEQLYQTVTTKSSDEQFIKISKIVQAENGHLIATVQHQYNQFLGGDILEFQAPGQAVDSQIIFNNFSPKPIAGGGVNLYPNQLSSRGWFSALSPYWDGSSRLLVSWAQCTTVENGVSSFCQADKVTDVNGSIESQYGIWVLDPKGNSRLPIVHAKQNTVYSDMALSQPNSGLDFPFQPYNADYVDNTDLSRIVCVTPEPDPVCEYGGVYPNCNSAPTCEYGGVYPACNPAPTCEFGGIYPACNPAPTCEYGGVYPNCNPAPTCEYGGVYPNCNPAPTCEFGGIYPACNPAPTCEYGGVYPNCNPAPTCEFGGVYPACDPAPTCEFGGVYPNCDPAPTCEFGGVYPNCDPEPTCEHGGVYPDCVVPNTAPVANAGPDQNVYVGSAVSLDGSASSDAEGDLLLFQWAVVSQPEGSSVALQNATSVTPGLLPEVVGVYVIELKVSDGQLTSAADTVTVTVSKANAAPVANAGADQSALINSTVNLDGSASSDPDGDLLQYQWNLISQPEGSGASLVGNTSVSPSFVPDVVGTYVVELRVNDGVLTSDADTTTITVTKQNTAPVANAGSDVTGYIDNTLALDGSHSFDPEGDTLSYQWTILSQPDGASASLTDAATVSPGFVASEPGVYVVQLVVNDGQLDSVPDTLSIKLDLYNRPPVANAGNDQSGVPSEVVSLDGSASSDPDGDALTFLWSLESAPASSVASIQGATSMQPTLQTDIAGSYVVKLVVNDGQLDSAPDTVTIVTKAVNHKPIADAGSDQPVNLDQVVALDGSGSRDQDGDPLTYQWTILSPANAEADLANATSVKPSLTISQRETYVVQLVVNDGLLDSDPDTVTLQVGNTKPVANAGNDQTGWPGTAVQLDGSASSDADGDPLTYHWVIVSQPANSATVLTDANAVMPSLTPDVYGVYTIQLVVNDGMADSDPDIVVINSQNTPPVANAGSDQAVYLNSIANLDGSGSSDADGDSLTYQWSLISQPQGSVVSLVNPTQVYPTLQIDVPGDYVAQLIVNDGTSNSEPDTVLISTRNTRPIADAGRDQSINVGNRVSLDGSGSSDPDGDSLTYRWSMISQPSGSNLSLDQASTVASGFKPVEVGTYVIQLIVNDGQMDSAPDSVVIEVGTSSCEISTDTRRSFPVIIRDFDPEIHPDFEYRIGEDYGIVEEQLGDDGIPVYAAYPKATPTTNGSYYFYKWYRSLPEWNIEIPMTLEMTREPGSTIWQYKNSSFFPIDGMGYGNTPGWNHNYHFTLEARLTFDYEGGEEFTFRGDDDLFVFINGKLAINLGGVHSVLERSIKLDEIAGRLGIVKGNSYSFDLFFAERHTTASNFMFQTNMNLECLPK
ncbi:PKD domain-containing protein [Teredinibacter sp. KSP-S5-2]|uniref:PKD domain-containing protein n=1 Tax=Teredinibacter sp. KSP-S5-2 TaxID=3034506 RepID=UPI002934820D|nr:PKD domain-containing protein [Teredinibacter sp. KSP-S5-2]WNO10729.1 PKD domain-containing protein [Teredinibacter sp. KSP-S5-2]